MDITTDGFGFMLNVGDLAWVPFTYTLQARYLAFNPISLGYFWSVVIFSVNAIGYYIFRASNSEKDEFRKGKNPKSMKFTFLLIHRHQEHHLKPLCCRSFIHANSSWNQIVDFWMVGLASTP
jgi:hypothetical protein